MRADGRVTADTARDALALFEVDELGLDKVDRAILGALCRTFAGQPVGLGTLAVAVGEEPETVEDVYEPFLLQCGLLERTPRGRVATPAAFAHLGLHDPPRPARLRTCSDRRCDGRRIGAWPTNSCRYEVAIASRTSTIDERQGERAVARRDRRSSTPRSTRAEDAGEEQVGALLHHRHARDVLGRLRPQGDALGRRRGGPARDRRRRADHAACSARRCRSSSRAPGHAVAAGALLLLGADERVGARGEFRIGLIETQIGMVLPRWAAELARERLSPRHFQQRDGRRARCTTPTAPVDAGFLDAVVDAERARRGRAPRRRPAGPSCHAAPTAGRCA